LSRLDASVIIASRERPALLRDAVRAVLDGEDVPRELILVDQSRAPDATLSRLSSEGRSGVRYLWSRSRGLSRGRNLGIAAASCGVVAFIDDDVLVSRTWLGVLVRTLSAPTARRVVTGQVRPAEPEVRGGFAPSTKVDERRVTYSGRSNLGVLFPNNAALPRTAFDEVGAFDERLGAGSTYPSSEDNDLCFRLLEAGYEIVYEPAAVVYHRAWRPPRAYLPLRWQYGRGQGAYYAKHFRLSDPFMIRQFAREGRRHALGALAHRTRAVEATGELTFLAAMLVGAAQWLLSERLKEAGTRAVGRRPSRT
jgi:GT2 family glycosyltransferase